MPVSIHHGPDYESQNNSDGSQDKEYLSLC